MKHKLDTSLERHSGSASLVGPCANLPANVRDYLDAVLEFAAERSADIVSIMIFGSAAKGEFSPVSDVDLFVVLADDVRRNIKKQLEHGLAVLELKYKLRGRPKSQVSVPLLMKAHLVKNCLGFLAFNACALAVYPLVPNATKYSMSALKWMLHTCHLCITLKSSTIEEAVQFFQTEIHGDAELMQLLSLRSLYRPSFRFVKGCFGTICRLYLVTVKQAVFPIAIGSVEHP